jgi:hypothetical protein
VIGGQDEKGYNFQQHFSSVLAFKVCNLKKCGLSPNQIEKWANGGRKKDINIEKSRTFVFD